MRNVEKDNSFTYSYQKFILVAEDGFESVLHTDRDDSVFQQLDVEDTLTINGDMYVVTRIHQHGDIDKKAKHYLYFVQHLSDSSVTNWLLGLLD